MTDYLTVYEIIAIHHHLINNYGGLQGIRDAGAIEAACYRPQSGYYKDIIEEAAALMESLAISHPFIDGNKRVAFAAADVFLRINGYKLNTDSATIFTKIINMFESASFEFKNIDAMLRPILTKLKLDS